MKFSKMKYIFLAILLLGLSCLTSCDDDEDIEYTVKIIATGGDFTGWYTVDGGDYNYIGTSDTTDGTTYYSYSKDIDDDISYMTIHADGTSTSVTYILIELYKDGDLVTSEEESQDDDTETISVSCTYDSDDDS